MKTKFSEFIRNATPLEKEAVYNRVMQAATDRQLYPNIDGNHGFGIGGGTSNIGPTYCGTDFLVEKDHG